MSDDASAVGRQVSVRRRALSLPTLVSFVVAGLFIFFLATRFNLDWSATWQRVRGMDPWLYALGFGLYYLGFLFRGMRWRLLARNAWTQAGPNARLPSFLRLSQLIVAGWFVNSVAWLRLGDAYRGYALARHSGGGFSWSLGTVLAERVADMATVFALLLVGAITFSTSSDHAASTYILGAASLMVVALAALLGLMRVGGPRLARFLPERLRSAYQGFHQGTMGSFKQLPAVFALGLVGWLLEVGRLYFVVKALGLSIGLPLVLLVSLGHALLSTVPTPGGIGAVEPGITGLLVLGLKRADAVSVVLVDRSITYLSILVIGGLLFLAAQMAEPRRGDGKAPTAVMPRGHEVADDA